MLHFKIFYLRCNFSKFAAFPFDLDPRSFVLLSCMVTIISPGVVDLFPIMFDCIRTQFIIGITPNEDAYNGSTDSDLWTMTIMSVMVGL